jgi:hypothetical protein
MGDWKETTSLTLILCILIFGNPLISAAELGEIQQNEMALEVRSDGSGLYDTIQSAIDAAQDGDIVIVGEGVYLGEGNRNLNFYGKSITVRSEEPDLIECVRSTIIDAEGIGVIVRFVNDEGPGSVFEGFTLFAGDRDESVRGVAGFFEFSTGARPITRNLRIGSSRQEIITLSEAPLLEDANAESDDEEILDPSGGISDQAVSTEIRDRRFWDGNNPFSQPDGTTDYYGSGDTDLDGMLTEFDVERAQKMVSGDKLKSSRADVDGDGDIDSSDVSKISAGVNGDILDGWWDQLSTRSERNAWIDKILSIDQTDKHPYAYWYQCVSYSLQTYINSVFYRGDLFNTVYDRGPSRFNVPMYYVSVNAPGFGHAINAILVGNNPLDFNKWRFIEPQTDETVVPGMWDMPYGSTLEMKSVSFVSKTGSFMYSGNKVRFYVDETGWSLEEYHPSLVLSRPIVDVNSVYNRPIVDVNSIDNRHDFWGPQIVSRGNGKLLFEKCRKDMFRTIDIYLGDLSFNEKPRGKRITTSSKPCRLLDLCKGPDGTIHLLWKEELNYVPGVFYGYILPEQNKVKGKFRVSSGVRIVRMGRIVVTDTGKIHVFWLEQNTNTNHPHESGIYWRKKTDTGWQSEVNVAPYSEVLVGSFYWDKADKLRYYFDAVNLGNKIVLVWAEPVWGIGESDLCQMMYNAGSWGPVGVLETGRIIGVDLVKDNFNKIHMAYWLTEDSWSSNRGDLVHCVSEDGLIWSWPEMVDSSNDAGYPNMCSTIDGKVYMIWVRRIEGRLVPVWSIYEDGVWSRGYLLNTREGSNAWYPDIESLDTGQVMAVWSSRSDDWVTVEKRTELLIGDFDGDGQINLDDLNVLRKEWLKSGPSICDIAPEGSCDWKVDYLDLELFTNYFKSQ